MCVPPHLTESNFCDTISAVDGLASVRRPPSLSQSEAPSLALRTTTRPSARSVTSATRHGQAARIEFLANQVFRGRGRSSGGASAVKPPTRNKANPERGYLFGFVCYITLKWSYIISANVEFKCKRRVSRLETVQSSVSSGSRMPREQFIVRSNGRVGSS